VNANMIHVHARTNPIGGPSRVPNMRLVHT